MEKNKIIDENYIKCVNGVMHRTKGVGTCNYCEAKKEVFDDIKKMVNDCIKKGLATEFILLQGIPTIEKYYLSPSAEESHNKNLTK